MNEIPQPTALITGASKGLGRALAAALAARGWRLVVDARKPGALAADLPDATVLTGDVTDPRHRADLAAAVGTLGRLDLLVNNASELGPSPLPALTRYPVEALRQVYETNVVAPLALIQLLAPRLRAAGGMVVNVSSDAAVEPYPGWGGYGSAKAALDQLSAVLGAEEPELRVYAVDPGDMRTDMHQAAFPGEDISDRPDPATVVPALLRLLDARPPSGRQRAADWAPPDSSSPDPGRVGSSSDFHSEANR
jgi:NAD(P)-dependent dehydrogenase (short-subunit alcohol dehydrogenase family)